MATVNYDDMMQSSEPGFESSFATVSKIGKFRSLDWRSSWRSYINDYLAIDSGGNVSDLVFARNCSITRMLPAKAELVSEWTGLPGMAKSVKRFERSNRLDIALYKKYLYFFCSYLWRCHIWHRMADTGHCVYFCLWHCHNIQFLLTSWVRNLSAQQIIWSDW